MRFVITQLQLVLEEYTDGTHQKTDWSENIPIPAALTNFSAKRKGKRYEKSINYRWNHFC